MPTFVNKLLRNREALMGNLVIAVEIPMSVTTA
jgi:hypothetical protein